MCVFVTHAPSVNTNTESFYILYIPSSFVCRLSSSGKREKKDLMRWKITNNRCSHAQVKKKNGEDCRNDEKKQKKQINKQKNKRNVIVWELVEKAESFWRNFDPHVFTF